MLKEEKRLKEEVRQLLEKAETIDEQEDIEYGVDRRGDELPEELARRESRLKRMINCLDCGFCMVECFPCRQFDRVTKSLRIVDCIQCGK